MGIGPPVVANRPDVDKSHLELLLRVSGWNERQHHRNQYNSRKPAADFPPHRGMHLRPRELRARVLGYSSPRFPTSTCKSSLRGASAPWPRRGFPSVIARHEVPKQSPSPALDCFAAPCTRRCRTPLAMTSRVSIGRTLRDLAMTECCQRSPRRSGSPIASGACYFRPPHRALSASTRTLNANAII